MTTRFVRIGENLVDLARLRPAFPHINARTDYGAVGDRTTDDQAALVAALTDGLADGLPVYLPPGIYRHTERLSVDSVTLFGVVPGAATLLGSTVAAHAVDLTGTSPEIHNVTVAGPSKAPRSSDRGGNGIYINAATGYVVRGCQVLDVPGAGIMTEFSSGGLVRGNQVQRTGADGIYTTEGTYGTEIAYNRLIVTGDDAIGVAAYPSGGMTHDVLIHHNSVLGNFESRGITVNGGDNITIHSNHIDGGTAGITTCSTAEFGTLTTSDVEAYGNTVRNINQARQDTGTIGGGALHLWNDLASADTGISVHDNRVYAPGLHGVYVGGTGAITATLAGNAFYLPDGLTRYLSDNSSAAITETGVTSGLLGDYPGDLVAASVGGIDPSYRYIPS